MSAVRQCNICECITTVYTCMNYWTEPSNTYDSSMWIFSLFWLLNWFQACFQSDAIVVSRPRTPYCLCRFTKMCIELWPDQKQAGDSALVKSKSMKTIYINPMRIITIWCEYRVRVMVFNATFNNNISIISCWLVLLVEVTGVPRANHWPEASHW